MGHTLGTRSPLDEVLLDLPAGSHPLLSARSHLVDVARRCTRWNWDHKLPDGLRGIPGGGCHVWRTLVSVHK